MISIISGTLKLLAFASIILLFSQVPLGKKRICDQVGDWLQSKQVKHALHWISRRFDFIEGNGIQRKSSVLLGWSSGIFNSIDKSKSNLNESIKFYSSPALEKTSASDRASLSGMLRKEKE